jgi:ATP-dependent Clp protease ATP-binding subunit ClpA
MIPEECDRLCALGHGIEVTPPAVELLVRQGYHRTLDARPMRGVVERQIQGAVAKALLFGCEGLGTVEVDSRQKHLVLVPQPTRAKTAS